MELKNQKSLGKHRNFIDYLKNKNFKIIVVLTLFMYSPNLIFILIGESPILSTNFRQIVFFIVSFVLFLFPLLIFRPKVYFGILLFFIPFFYLDIYMIFISKNFSTSSYYVAILLTNYEESKEFLFSNIGFFIITFFSVCGFLIIWKNLDFNYIINRRFKFGIFLFCSGVLCLLFLKLFFGQAKKLTNSMAINNSVWIFNHEYSKNSYPLGSILKITELIQGQRKIKQFDTSNSGFSYKVRLQSDENQTIVLVLGESARKHNFQLYGYHRETNPLLSELKNLIVFENTVTNANFTHTSFSLILSSVNVQGFNEYLSEKGIAHSFKEAGFDTYWITNQNYPLGSIYCLYSKQADKIVDVSLNEHSKSFDEKILPFFNKILNDGNKKRFIVIHTMGSHYMYNSRYPKKFSKFTPDIGGIKSMSKNSLDEQGRDMFVNSYDNSILYTDFILSSLIKYLKKNTDPSIMLYVSDHGENLYDDEDGRVLHGGSNPTIFELEIPMLLWYSDYYQKSKIDRIKSNSAKKISSSVIFHTLSRLGGFRTTFHQNQYNLLSDSLKVGNRLFYVDDGSIINIDK